MHQSLTRNLSFAALIWLAFFCATIVFFPSCVSAFYSYSEGDINLSLGGFIGLGAGVAKYPKDTFLYEERSEGSWYGDFRFLGEGSYGENLTASMNVLQNVSTTPPTLITKNSLQKDVERSSSLYWQQHDSPNTRAAMVIDAVNVTWGNWSNELTVGRQPITTTVTFFFTPNDFFAPFSPNTFFRVYKPGVDAARFEKRLAALSQLSVIGVLGYKSEFASDSGWSNSPEWERSSTLGRMTYTIGDYELGALYGIVRESMVTGFSLQGELFSWLGVRSEGHYAHSWVDNQDSGFMMSVSLEHRFANNLTMRMEYMYNGHGFDSIEEALAKRIFSLNQGYLGRHYTAVDLSYEITPLLFGEVLYLQNWSDDSYSVSFNAVYSVSDESEITVTAMLPGGSEPETGQIKSELGSLPVRVSLAYRLYF